MTEGYGVAFNSPEFIRVPRKSYSGGAIYLFLGILPVFALMTTLAVLHINGRLNGFNQLVTLQFPGLGYPSWVFKNYFEEINFHLWKIMGFCLSTVPGTLTSNSLVYILHIAYTL